jgi:hypothetical protein
LSFETSQPERLAQGYDANVAQNEFADVIAGGGEGHAALARIEIS